MKSGREREEGGGGGGGKRAPEKLSVHIRDDEEESPGKRMDTANKDVSKFLTCREFLASAVVW